MNFLTKIKRIAEAVGLSCFVLLALYGMVALLRGDLLRAVHAQSEPPASSPAAASASDASAASRAALPSVVHYQGDLRGNAGQLLEGTYDLTFRIYDAAVGGAVVWPGETLHSVPVRAGHFSVLLGDTNPLNADVFSDPNRYIGLTVSPDAEMIPRQRFSVVPYAFWAGGAAQADHAVNTDHAVEADHAYALSAPDGAPLDAVFVNNAGNVGIGTTNPQTRLDVSGQTQLSGESEVLGLKGQNQTFIGLYRSASGAGRRGYIGFPAADILHLVNEVPGGSINIGTNGGNVGINTTSPQATLDVNGNLNFTGQKVCSVYESGVWRDYLLVPSSWTAQTCADWMTKASANGYQLACIFESGSSIGTISHGVPSPNCGW